MLVEGGHLTNTDVEGAEAVFASIFNNTDRPWAAQFFDLEDYMVSTIGLQTLKL